MGGSNLQRIGEVEGALEKRVARLEVVEDGEVLREEAELGEADAALGVVLERELQLREPVEELARELVEEEGALAVELRGHPDRGAAHADDAAATASGGALGSRRRCWWWRERWG